LSVIQIIDDDKGVHVVAAINLYESIPESSLMGIAVCHELVSQEVGCAIGMAQGPTFCGVTGCSTIACRWDVTGPPAVRAARLMQYALDEEIDIAIDVSVYNDSPMATAKLTVQNPSVQLKGTKGAVPIYTLSNTKISAAFRVLETLYRKNNAKTSVPLCYKQFDIYLLVFLFLYISTSS
jgi:class 3 adenylate cyclase